MQWKEDEEKKRCRRKVKCRAIREERKEIYKREKYGERRGKQEEKWKRKKKEKNKNKNDMGLKSEREQNDKREMSIEEEIKEKK